MTYQRLNKAPWKEKKIKQNKPPKLHERVKSFTMSNSPEALLRPVPP